MLGGPELWTVFLVLVTGYARLPGFVVTWLLLMTGGRSLELRVQIVSKEQNFSLCESNWATKENYNLGLIGTIC